ncbi:spore protease YyaC [Metabacillus fastidiosus]|uniref:spore protease YyaC n=1 Tax=Metabacillus fastidiosus TaxID=1458 RepID=UPI002E2290BF|nr:spore protease YyaC [Metabacillus fastidiosus]
MNYSKTLYKQLIKESELNIGKELVIVCVGTDRSTGDSLGPLVGTYLSEMNIKNFIIYGTIEEPVHAVNLQETMDLINKRHSDPFVIAIDACLGAAKSVGEISFIKEPLRPGEGVGKKLPAIGVCSITGVVNVSGHMEMLVLQNTRLAVVMKMAKEIAEIIRVTDYYLTNKYYKEIAAAKL